MLNISSSPIPPMPARRLTAAASICGLLRDAIVAHRLTPGSALSEKDLTARFGVSRTPVREALIRLAEEGLVDIRPQAGTFVARIPLGAIPEAVLVRQALEGTTVEIATRRIAQEGDIKMLGDIEMLGGIEILGGIIARQEAFARLDDREAFHEADEAFHEAIAVLSGHPGIWRIVKASKIQLDRCRRLTLPVPGRMTSVIVEHEMIVAAIREGDTAAARAAMQTHLQAVLPDATRLAQSHPDYFV